MKMQPEQDAMRQSKIIRVEAFDGDSFGVTLESGHTILLELAHRIREPAFAALVDSDDFCRPYTDGKAICWPGGVKIPLEEILGMLLSPDSKTQNQHNHKEE